MSVSSRSPLMSGVLTTKRLHASTKIGVSGFPATSGIRSAAVCTADTSVPLPGAIPPATGIVQSIFVTIHGIPGRPDASSQRSANAASAKSRHPTSGANPCTTASGCSVAERTTTYPSRSSSVTILSPPTTSTRGGAATCSASNRMAACGEVTTCSGATSNPNSRRCAATVLSLREALLVIYPTGIRTATFRRLSTASGMALAPAYTTPSRSANTASTPNSGVPATDAPPSRLSPRRAALSAPSASDTSPPLPSPCWLVPRSCLDARSVWFQPPTLTSLFPLLASALPPPSPPLTPSPSTPPSTPTSPPPPSPSPPTPSPPSSSSSSPSSPISTMTTTSSDFNSSTSSARSAGSSHVEASPVLPSSVSTSA